MNALVNAIYTQLIDGELASVIAKEIGNIKLKTKINDGIKKYLSEGGDVKSKKPAKKTVEKKENKKTVKKEKSTKKESDEEADEPKDYKKMKVVDLKALLKEKGLSTTGKKDELIERLQGAEESGEEKSDKASDTEADSDKEEEKPKKKVKKAESEDDSVDAQVDYKKMKVTELRELAKKRKLDSKGKKEELIARLEGGDSQSEEEKDSETEEDKKEVEEDEKDEEGGEKDVQEEEDE